MDLTTDTIATFVDELEFEHLGPAVVHQAKCRLVDSIGCALGALGSPPARIARAVAEQTSAQQPATVFGSRHRSSPELAAFANAAMIRYLDFNDMFSSTSGGGGHPSDLISAALAVGESLGSTGEEVLLSIVAGYEVLGHITGVVRLRERGWDQGIHVVVGAAMAAGKLFGLNRDQLGHAISLAIIPNICTRAARVGELSMWKGCATAGATKAGVFAAILANNGMTGPPAPFDGYDGIKHRITGPFELEMAAIPERFVIEQVHTKCWPAEYNAQGAIELTLRLGAGIDPRAIEHIDVSTYWLAYSEIGMEPEKWAPHSRETADHSLPYLIARALLDGDIRVDSFTAERIADPRAHELMQRITVAEDADYSARFPGELLCSLVIRLADGTEVSGEIAHPRGHVRNPIDAGDLDRKFDGLVAGLRDQDRHACAHVRTALWKAETIDNIEEVLEPLSGIDVPDDSR